LQLIETKSLAKAKVVPTAYDGIFDVKATRQLSGKPQNFRLTTHLDQAQVNALLAQADAEVNLPGQNLRGQWLNIVSTVVIAGLVVFLILYQTRLGQGKNSRVRQRPNVSFRDVAGIEEAKE
jgi:ATP-dependent Zn protease